MNKKWIGWMGICCGVLLLTGCDNKAQIQWLMQSQAGLTDEVQALSKRVKALEQSVWRARNELVTMQSHATELEAAVAANEESKAAASDKEEESWMQKGPKDSTPYELNKIVGMSAEKLTQFAGKPDKQATLADAEYWTYANMSYQGTNGAKESASVQVVLENGRVIRATFSDSVRYDTQ